MKRTIGKITYVMVLVYRSVLALPTIALSATLLLVSWRLRGMI